MTRPRSQVLLAAVLGLVSACPGGGGDTSSGTSTSGDAPPDPTTDAPNPFDTASPDLGGPTCSDRVLPGPCFNTCEFEAIDEVAEACGALPPSGPVAYQPLLLECTCVRPEALTIADVDGDGLGDVIARCGGDELKLWFGGTGRPLDCPQSLAVASESQGAIAVYDLDGDGHRDIVAVGDDTVSVVRGLGGRAFAPQYVSDVGVPSAWSSAVVTRADGDAVDDLLVRDRYSFQVQVLLGDGAGGFTAGSRWLNKDPCDIDQLTDLDDDGRVDVLLLCLDGVRAAPGAADGGFGPVVELLAGVDELAAVRAAKLDDDAWVDLIAARQGDLVLARGTGPGSFAAPALALSSAAVDRLAVVDLDGDAPLEVVGWTEFGFDLGGGLGALALFDQDGAGALTEAGRIETPRGVAALAVGDLNGDGRGELLFTMSAQSGNTWNGILVLESAP